MTSFLRKVETRSRLFLWRQRAVFLSSTAFTYPRACFYTRRQRSRSACVLQSRQAKRIENFGQLRTPLPPPPEIELRLRSTSWTLKCGVKVGLRKFSWLLRPLPPCKWDLGPGGSAKVGHRNFSWPNQQKCLFLKNGVSWSNSEARNEKSSTAKVALDNFLPGGINDKYLRGGHTGF